MASLGSSLLKELIRRDVFLAISIDTVLDLRLQGRGSLTSPFAALRWAADIGTDPMEPHIPPHGHTYKNLSWSLTISMSANGIS